MQLVDHIDPWANDEWQRRATARAVRPSGLRDEAADLAEPGRRAPCTISGFNKARSCISSGIRWASDPRPPRAALELHGSGDRAPADRLPGLRLGSLMAPPAGSRRHDLTITAQRRSMTQSVRCDQEAIQSPEPCRGTWFRKLRFFLRFADNNRQSSRVLAAQHFHVVSPSDGRRHLVRPG